MLKIIMNISRDYICGRFLFLNLGCSNAVLRCARHSGPQQSQIVRKRRKDKFLRIQICLLEKFSTIFSHIKIYFAALFQTMVCLIWLFDLMKFIAFSNSIDFYLIEPHFFMNESFNTISAGKY